MSDINPNEEWNQLTEVYRQMADEELLNFAAQEQELTDIARQVLQGEMQARGLKCEAPARKAAKRSHSFESLALPESADHGNEVLNFDGAALIAWQTVETLEQAQRMKEILDSANIVCCFGKNMLEEPGEIDSFVGGVPVVISAYDRKRAEQAWAEANPNEYLEALESQRAEQEEPPEAACCPSCGSFEIVLMEVDGASGNYNWHCDACGHEWTDDGVAQYKPLPESETEENL